MYFEKWLMVACAVCACLCSGFTLWQVTQYHRDTIEIDRELVKIMRELNQTDAVLDAKLDGYMETHIKRMGPEHRKRLYEALKPYIEGRK